MKGILDFSAKSWRPLKVVRIMILSYSKVPNRPVFHGVGFPETTWEPNVSHEYFKSILGLLQKYQ